jgi:hypothetical protein
MPQDNDLNETKAVSKLSKTRNNRDSALLHLMFIRDEITLLPRPRQGQHKKKLDDEKTGRLRKQLNTTSSKRCSEKLAEEISLNALLLERLDEYELAIQRIDRIALHALCSFSAVQVGGRKPKLEINEMAKAIAKRHMEHKKELPTWKELHYEVRHHFFKNDPQLFIKKMKKGMDPVEAERNSIDPKWSYWRTVEGFISERKVSSILTQLRNENKKIQQK